MRDKESKVEKKQVMTYLGKDAHLKLKYLAVDLDTSVSAMIREAIDDYLEKLERNKN